MKLGLLDYKYIPNRPTVSHRKRDRGKLIPPSDALWNKAGYELYQRGDGVSQPEPDTERDASDARSETQSITPEAALRHKLGYDQYRDESTEEGTQRSVQRRYFDYGLGKSRGELAHRCNEFAGKYNYCETLWFSPDPGALELVDASERIDFMHDCTETFIDTVCAECFGIDEIEHSFVFHHKPDRVGRERIHAHITVAGTYYDDQRRTRVTFPFVGPEQIRQMQTISDRVVEKQLDLYFGPEWRLIFPEYEATYQHPRADLVDLPLDLQLGMLLEAPIDSFGDEIEIARLVDELFGEPVTEKKDEELSAAPTEPSAQDELDEYFPRQKVPAKTTAQPEMPAEEPDYGFGVRAVDGRVGLYVGKLWMGVDGEQFGQYELLGIFPKESTPAEHEAFRMAWVNSMESDFIDTFHQAETIWRQHGGTGDFLNDGPPNLFQTLSLEQVAEIALSVQTMSKFELEKGYLYEHDSDDEEYPLGDEPAIDDDW